MFKDMLDDLRESGSAMFPDNIAFVSIKHILEQLRVELMYVSSCCLTSSVPDLLIKFDAIKGFLEDIGFLVEYGFETFTFDDVRSMGFTDPEFLESLKPRCQFVIYTDVVVNGIVEDFFHDHGQCRGYFRTILDFGYSAFLRDKKGKG